MSLKVTFYLFAYNQERYIREACEAALAQDYPDLEIIFSDDCSTDSTFEIMQDVARTYQGPHRLVLNRNRENRGLMHHVNVCNQIAAGDLIVAANDDDISEPHRVSKIVQVYQARKGCVHSIHSSVTEINAEGKTLGIRTPPLVEENMALPEMARALALVIGASYAWTREIFNHFGPITQTHAYEDLVIAFRSALLGEIAYIPEPLVRYRIGHISASNWQEPTTHKEVQHYIRREQRLALAVYRQRLRDCERAGRLDLAPGLHQLILRSQYQLLLGENKYPRWKMWFGAALRRSLKVLREARRLNRQNLETKLRQINSNLMSTEPSQSRQINSFEQHAHSPH